MPPIRTTRASRKAPPPGFEDIEDTLLEFAAKMKDAENASHEGKKKYETVWPIFQISHQRSRYIYELYYEKEAIDKKLYEWLLKEGYADAMLIAKWKKMGYEKVRGVYLERVGRVKGRRDGGWELLSDVLPGLLLTFSPGCPGVYSSLVQR